jgi:hypothetical protein
MIWNMTFTLLSNNCVTHPDQQSNTSYISDITHKDLSLVEITYSLVATLITALISSFFKDTKQSTKSILSLCNNFSKKLGNITYVRYLPCLFGRVS